MKKTGLIFILCFLTGCTVRTYTVVKDRIDQEISGNEGFLMGGPPEGWTQESRFTERQTKVVEIELLDIFKAKKASQEPEGHRQKDEPQGEANVSASWQISGEGRFQDEDSYIVKEGDTLAKIAGRPEIYGSNKQWRKLFDANRGQLDSPDKIYAGQKLKIPRE